LGGLRVLLGASSVAARCNKVGARRMMCCFQRATQALLLHRRSAQPSPAVQQHPSQALGVRSPCPGPSAGAQGEGAGGEGGEWWFATQQGCCREDRGMRMTTGCSPTAHDPCSTRQEVWDTAEWLECAKRCRTQPSAPHLIAQHAGPHVHVIVDHPPDSGLCRVCGAGRGGGWA